MKRVLFIFGTRPEAIKLCPAIRRVREVNRQIQAAVCVTAQHRSMLDQVLDCFGVVPDFDLNLMTPGQSLSETTSRILESLDRILAAESFDMAVVQGDTTSTMAGALAAFHRKIPVAHVEAGLRTHDLAQPFPEEMNRQVTARLATLHFAPTAGARCHLLAEGIPEARVMVTGNTGIDALLYMVDSLERGQGGKMEWPWLDRSKKLIVVTAHRRESFGDGLDHICEALAELATRDDVQLVYPVHRNPSVLDRVTRALSGRANIILLEPQGYPPFVDLMRRSYLVLTDSGGIQEEAPSLGKPVLVMRDCTERPEAVEAGTVKLVGTGVRQIVGEVTHLLDDEEEYHRRSRIHNPYGDGRASERIIDAIARYLAEAGA